MLHQLEWRIGTMSLPDVIDPERFAFFFDFDGTLADIVEHPEDVEVSEPTRHALAQLWQSSGGAVAIVTGRDIGSIDHFLDPERLPIAGVHGLTRRDGTGHVHRPEFDMGALNAIEAELRPLVDRETGLLLERKQGAIALHYRQRPELEDLCRDAMARAAENAGSITVRRGKMVVEVVGYPSNKGSAIESFLQEKPFLGRTPIFAGDDLTDEDGFALVNERGGLSIKVGPGDTKAHYRVEGRQELLAWLNSIITNRGHEHCEQP
jgi:trehalose 6-phosphate phosphatase